MVDHPVGHSRPESLVLSPLLSIALLALDPAWAGRPPPEALARAGSDFSTAQERLDVAVQRIDAIERSVDTLRPMLDLCALDLELTHQQPPASVLALSSKERMACIDELTDRVLEQLHENEDLIDELMKLESVHKDIIEVLVRDLIGVVEAERVAPEALGDPPRRLERRTRRAKTRSSRRSRKIHQLKYERLTAIQAARRAATDEDRVASMWASTELLVARRHAELDFLLASADVMASVVVIFERRERGMAKLYAAALAQHP